MSRSAKHARPRLRLTERGFCVLVGSLVVPYMGAAGFINGWW